MIRRILASQQAGLVLVIVLLGIVLSVFAGSHLDRATGQPVNNFLNSYTLIQTATDASFFAIMAVGATIVIISGGIDLSVGLDLRAGRRDDGAGPARASGRCGTVATVALGLGVSLGVGLVCGALNGADGRRAARAPVHHHARHDVDPARHRVRREQARRASCCRRR